MSKNGISGPVMKRTIQDSVFTDLFRDKKYLIQLYQALHPEDMTVTEDDIVTVTIQNILTDSPYNDLGIMVKDKLLILAEAQSTWSENIVVRALMYLMQTYNEYFREQSANLYRSRKVRMPKPELYMIYTGEHSKRPEYISLREEFFGGEECAVEARVKVIYDSSEGDIINQYIVFTKVCKEQVKLYGRNREAVSETIRICKDRDVLREYLQNREKEVADIMIALYDEEEIMRRYVESEIAEAVEMTREEGRAEGRAEGIIETGYELGLSEEDILKRLRNKLQISEETAKEYLERFGGQLV